MRWRTLADYHIQVLYKSKLQVLYMFDSEGASLTGSNQRYIFLIFRRNKIGLPIMVIYI